MIHVLLFALAAAVIYLLQRLRALEGRMVHELRDVRAFMQEYARTEATYERLLTEEVRQGEGGLSLIHI